MITTPNTVHGTQCLMCSRLPSFLVPLLWEFPKKSNWKLGSTLSDSGSLIVGLLDGKN